MPQAGPGRIAESLVTLGLTLLGLVLVATPLALWVAWSDTMLFAVLAAGAAAGVLYCLLARFEQPARPAQGKASGIVRREALPDWILGDLQRLRSRTDR